MSLSSFDKSDSIYMQNGYRDRKEYLESMSENFSVDIDTVNALADLLGPDEDFDGLIVALEDAQ